MPEDNERIAVVEKAIEGIERGMSRMEQKLDSLLDNIEKKFVPRHEYDSAQEHLHGKFAELSNELKSMKGMFWKIVGGLIMIIVTLAAALIGSGKL
jgi:chromosome segregation ATPase